MVVIIALLLISEDFGYSNARITISNINTRVPKEHDVGLIFG